MDKVQRLILINQYRILSLLDEDNRDGFDKVIKALESGYEAEISNLVSDSAYGWLDKQECYFVGDVLDMYAHIEDSIGQMGPGEAAKAAKLPWIDFKGFDGNNEAAYMGYVHYLIVEDGRWAYTKFGKQKTFNSHMPSIDKYRSMVEVHGSFERGNALTLEQLEALSKA